MVQTGRCPSCRAEYTLTADVAARAMGKQAQCNRCGAIFRLSESPKTTPVLGYETPAALRPPVSTNCYAEAGDVLVIRDGDSTPARCVKCNAPASFWLRKKYYSEVRGTGTTSSDALGAILALIGLILLIVQLCTRQSVTVRLALCGKHQASRKTWMWISAGVMVLGPVAFLLPLLSANFRGRPDHLAWLIVTIVLAVACFLTGIVMLCRFAMVLEMKKMEGRRVWLTGASQTFLASLSHSDL